MKINKLLESKKIKEGTTNTEPIVKFQGKSSHTFTKDKKWEVDFDEAGNILARTRHGKPSYFKGHINDKTNDFPSTDEDNIILAAREQHGLKFGNKEFKEGYSHFEFTSGSNPYIAKTKSEVDRIKRSRGDSVKYVGNINGIDYYKVDDGEKDLFRVDEAFKPTDSGIQSVKVYNRYNYTIQELRVDNDNKTFERGNFTAGKPDKKTKNRQEFEDIVDTLKKLGYIEIKSDYRSMRNKSRKGTPTSVEEGYELSPRIDYNPNHLRDDEGKIMADRWYASKWPDDEVGIEQLQGLTLDDALKDRSILGHCDTQVRERVYAQLDRYIPLSKESPMYKEKNESKESEESELITQYINNGEFDKLEKVHNGTNVVWKLKESISESNSTYNESIDKPITERQIETFLDKYGFDDNHTTYQIDSNRYAVSFNHGISARDYRIMEKHIKSEFGDKVDIYLGKKHIDEDDLWLTIIVEINGSMNESSEKGLTYEELMELAHKNYNKGGDSVYECWGKEEFDEYVKEFGPITKEKAYKLFGMYDEVNRDRDGYMIESKSVNEDVYDDIRDMTEKVKKYTPKVIELANIYRETNQEYSIVGSWYDRFKLSVDCNYIPKKETNTYGSISSDTYLCIEDISRAGEYEKCALYLSDKGEIFIEWNPSYTMKTGYSNYYIKCALSHFLSIADKAIDKLLRIMAPESKSIKESKATHCVYFTQDGIEQIEFEGTEDECDRYISAIQAEQDDEFGDEAPERFVKRLTEASYGGAFDIADDQYFTREDLDSFAEEVLNHINETFKTQFDIASCYIDNGVLEVGVTNDEYGDYLYSEKIDMRKIKEPWHLKRAYAFEFASQLINDITQTNDGLVEAYDDDVDDITYYYEDEVFKHNLETNPYTEIETKQVPDSDGFMTDYTMYMDMNTGEYVFILGDREVYCPDNGYFYFDWECETEEEAREWFANYHGFEESEFDDFEESDEQDEYSRLMGEEVETSPIVHKKPDGSYLVAAENGDGYVAYNRSDVCMGNISASSEDEARVNLTQTNLMKNLKTNNCIK